VFLVISKVVLTTSEVVWSTSEVVLGALEVVSDTTKAIREAAKVIPATAQTGLTGPAVVSATPMQFSHSPTLISPGKNVPDYRHTGARPCKFSA